MPVSSYSVHISPLSLSLVKVYNTTTATKINFDFIIDKDLSMINEFSNVFTRWNS